MEVIRRNTDYALRLMVNLALHYREGFISSRLLAEQEDVSYQLACKLLQKLKSAGLVESSMGSKGGFVLRKPASKINLFEIIDVIQGPILINRCLLSKGACKRQKNCPITNKLSVIQEYINKSLANVTLDDLVIS